MIFAKHNYKREKEEKKKLISMVMSVDDDKVTLQDSNHIIYTFGVVDSNISVGDVIELEYSGSLNKNKTLQDNEVLGYKTISVSNDEEEIPSVWQDDGIFKDFYIFAAEKLKTMTKFKELII